MYFHLFVILGLLSWIEAAKLPSFHRPEYPISTVDNDGTNTCRYDVRKTMVFFDLDPTNTNSYYFLLWITTTNGDKYHYTIDPVIVGANTSRGIFTFEDLNRGVIYGGSTAEPAVVSRDYLNIQSSAQNLTSPKGGDNFTNLHLSTNYAGVAIDVDLTPTGKNFYHGGSGGFTLPANLGQDRYEEVIPGYTWYWSNPTMKLGGTIIINDTVLAIDPNQSFAFMERQWGRYSTPDGWLAFWLYLSNGIMIHSWIVAPKETGYGVPAIASIWHPDGAHEVLPIDPDTKGWDAWESPKTSYSYFSKFLISISTRQSTLNVEKLVAPSEVSPAGNSTDGIVIAESYCQGNGTWEGKPVAIYGHVEQYPAGRSM